MSKRKAETEQESNLKRPRDEPGVSTEAPVSAALPEPPLVTFQDISTAAFHIRDGVPRTPLQLAGDPIQEATGMEIYFKKDYLLHTGSFKERGARNSLMKLKRQGVKGVIAASAGNHALALSYHGRKLDMKVIVVMPDNAPLMKVTRCKSFGATVLQHGSHIMEARDKAMEIAQKEGYIYVNGFNDPEIIAGAGTMGLEILEELPMFDAIVVPIGGGGLVAGICIAFKALRPDITIIGVEPSTCPSWSEALKAGKPVTVPFSGTLADGLGVPCVGGNSFALAHKLIDRVELISEKFIAMAVLKLVESEKAVVEGAGAIGLAACLQGCLSDLKGKRVVVPLCGANMDTPVLGRALERGLAEDGRLHRFIAVVEDKPGGLARLFKAIAEMQANVRDVYHERAWLDSNIFAVQVKVLVETRNHEHGAELRAHLEKNFKLFWGVNL